MEHQLIVVGVYSPDGVLFDVPVLVASFSEQDESLSDLLKQLPNLFLAEDDVRVFFGQEILVK